MVLRNAMTLLQSVLPLTTWERITAISLGFWNGTLNALGGVIVMDVILISATFAFFMIAIAYIRGCVRL